MQLATLLRVAFILSSGVLGSNDLSLRVAGGMRLLMLVETILAVGQKAAGANVQQQRELDGGCLPWVDACHVLPFRAA